MKKVLIAYTTNSGSTKDVAEAIGEVLGKVPFEVEIRRMEEVTSLDGYSAVVAGAPMIMGWHANARKFIRKHQKALSHLPVAFFFMAMSLTKTPETQVDGTPITVDAGLAVPPKRADRLSFKERYARVTNYLHPVLKAAPLVKPVSVGFFGGKLELFRLKWWQMLFVMLIIQAQPGENRNWPVIREWAANLGSTLLKDEPVKAAQA